MPEDAATILIVRDGPDAGQRGSVEVFMLERHLKSDFAGGAYVFPGGKVDQADLELGDDRWTGVDVAERAAQLDGDEAMTLGLYVAAVRETFEEAGVLLGTRAGRPITADDLAEPDFVDARERLNVRGEAWDWRPWLAEHDIVLDLGALQLWSWWVTPEGQHRRFDTRFFIALMPPEQAGVSSHDDVETTASRWTTPQAVLDAHARGEVMVIFPTRCNLDVLAEYSSARGAWDAAAAGEVDTRCILPTVTLGEDGTPLVQHPYGGDPQPI